MKTLPILLKNKIFLLIGGGKVAFAKAQVLLSNNIDFFVVSKEFIKEFETINVEKYTKIFEISDLENIDVVVDASGNSEVGAVLHTQKQIKHFWLNRVDNPKECDFYFSSLLNCGHLKIAISSDGASPSLTQLMREKIKRIIPKDLENLCEKTFNDRQQNIINTKQTKEEFHKIAAKCYLIGCGLGDPELLTIKAYKTIQILDVALYDHLISQEILDLIPVSCEKINVGKQKDFHLKSQDEINELIIKYTKEGKIVGRLKSGDPFVFGRGSEEIAYLAKHEVDFEVIAGISSSIAAPLLANIPITARGVSDSFSVVSAHLKDNRLNLEWIELLKRPKHTVIVLMGISKVDEIVAAANKHGVDMSKLCAIISNASRPNQKITTSSIANLAFIADKFERPAIMVFGDVVKFHQNFI